MEYDNKISRKPDQILNRLDCKTKVFVQKNG